MRIETVFVIRGGSPFHFMFLMYFVLCFCNRCRMDEVLEFIERRFKKDCDWINGNCYYFALILKDRFPGGASFYDVIAGHFVYSYNGNYYDWIGIVKPEENSVYINWDEFALYDELQKKVIVRDCIK